MVKSPINQLIGQPNGVAPLDGSKKIPSAHLVGVIAPTDLKGVTQAASRLLDDPTVAAQRDTLELGSAALSDSTDFLAASDARVAPVIARGGAISSFTMIDADDVVWTVVMKTDGTFGIT